MSRYCMAYVGPPAISPPLVDAKMREMPYARSLQVTAEPSCHLIPSRMVNDQDLKSALGVPRSVAMSGTSVVPTVGSFDRLYASSDRVVVAPKNARSSPV